MERKPNAILRQERKRRGWSQGRLAHELNHLISEDGGYGAASEDMVRKWEHGIHTPSPFYLVRLCEVFECTADQLGIGAPLRMTIQAPEPLCILASLPPSLHLVYLTTVIDHWRAWFHDLQALIQQEVQHMDRMSRRETLLALAALPAALTLLQAAPPIEEELARYATSLTACTNLYYDGGAEVIKPHLAGYLPRLAALAKTPTKHQKSAAALASQAYQLDWLLALQEQDFGRALVATREGATCGEIAGNLGLVAAAYTKGAHVYFHLKNPTQQMKQYRLALQYATNASPLLKSWMNMNMAETYANLHQTKEAERLINLAREQFPEHPQEDPAASFLSGSPYRLAIWETRTALRLSQPEKALTTIKRVEHEIPESLIPTRVELLNQRLVALCALGELDEACRLFEIAERGARLSKLRYNEVGEVYSTMHEKWPQEQRVLELEELFHR